MYLEYQIFTLYRINDMWNVYFIADLCIVLCREYADTVDTVQLFQTNLSKKVSFFLFFFLWDVSVYFIV